MSLVPYAARLAPRATLGAYRIYNRRRNFAVAGRVARIGFNMAKYAYKRRRRAVYRMRKRRRFSPPNPSSGTATSKRHQIRLDAGGTAIGTRSLISENLAAIPHSTANTIDERQRNILNLRGTKLCFEVTNNTDDPLYFNCAVIVPKLSSAVTTTDFFRGSTGERAEDFGVALTGLQFHCLPINSDKYHILWHKRYKLRPLNNSTGTQRATSGSNYMNIEKYIKYKRQIRFTGNSDTNAEGGAPFLVFWGARFDTASGTAVTAGGFTVQRRFISYFKEPR